MQNQQASKIGSGGVVDCFHGRFLLLKSVTVSILKGVYCLFFWASTMLGSFPSDEVGKSYTHPVGVIRLRVRSRTACCSLLGMKLAFNKPCWSRSAIHSASLTSVFRPGTAFMCCAFTSTISNSSSGKSKIGFQYTPV